MDLRERSGDEHQRPRHPWERARLAFVDDLVTAHAAAGDVVDIGAGDGFVAHHFARRGRRVVAVDAHYNDDDLAKLRTGGVQATTTVPTGRQFTLALLLDVIEHVDDDVGLLRVARDVLVDDGVAVITVPAWPQLFSRHDRALHHHRRYTPASLRTAVELAGLRVVVDGGLFHSLIAPRLLSVVGERLRPRRTDDRVAGVGGFDAPGVVGDVVAALLRGEQFLSRAAARHRLQLPGLSLFAVVAR